MQDPLTWIVAGVAIVASLIAAWAMDMIRRLKAENRGLKAEAKMLELANTTRWWDMLSPEQQERGRKIAISAAYGDKEAR